MNGNVFDVDGKAPTLTTNKGEGTKVGRMAGVAVGKNGIRPYTAGGGGLQEIGTIGYETGKAVTVTAEHPPKICTGLVLAGHDTEIKHEQQSRVYAPEGKSPTLMANSGGGGTTKCRR